jgi:hypothetical protein
VSLARADYTPIALTPGSFTQDLVVEKGASPPLANFTTATPDQGTNNYGSTFFEQGYMVSVPELGLPAHGTTFSSRALSGHTFQMPPSYVTNNAAFIGAANIPGTSTLQTQVVSTALSISDPTAYGFISILWASGGSNDVNGVNVTVTHADNNQETFQITPIDWMSTVISANGSYVAWVCAGRIALDGTPPINSQRGTAAAKLFSNDFALSDTTSPVTGVAISIGGTTSTAFRFFVFGVSGSTDGSTYTPVASLSGFNKDAVIEAGLPCNQNPGCNVTMDGGPNCNGYTYYEQGFGTNVGGNSPNNVGTQGLPGTGTTGLPHPGTTITSGIYSFQMPASYVGNDCVFIGNYPAGALSNGIYGTPSYLTGTFTITSPQAYTALSILGSAGSGPCTNSYTVNYSDGSTQSGSLVVVDWHNTAVGVFTTLGRVAVDTPGLDRVGVTSSGRLWHNDIVLSNTTAAATSVVLTWTGGGRNMFFALSAQTASGGNFSPIVFTGLNADGIIEAGLPLYPSSLFNATTATMDLGTNNANYTWFERGWATNGIVASACGLPPAGSIINSLQDATRHYQMPSTYMGPNAVLIDTNHQVVNITPITPTAGSALALLTTGASIGAANVMTNLCILQHANGVNETNIFYGYDWFSTKVPAAFLSSGRMSTLYHSLSLTFSSPQFPGLFETIFPTVETVSPVTNIQVRYKLAGGASWTTYVLAVSATAGSVAPVLGPVIQAVGSATTFEGSNVVFTATESGTLPITNQWQFSADSGVTWVNITNGGTVSGATTASVTNSSVGWTNAGQYRLTASNLAGSSTNLGAALVVYSGLPDITQPTDPISAFQPNGGSSPAAEPVANAIDDLVGTNRDSKYLNFGVNGTVAPFVGPVGLVVSPAIGKTAVSVLRIYTANDHQERDPIDYGLEGSNDGGNTWSFIAGGTLNLPVARNGAGAGASVPPNPLIHALQEIRFPNTAGYFSYRLSFTNVFTDSTATCMQIGEVEFLGVQTPSAPFITRQPVANVKTFVGSSPTFVVAAVGYPTNLAYQWYFNGTGLIPGATNASYTLANAQLQDSGSTFSCMITNSIGSTPSASATLTVIAPPTSAYPTTVMADSPVAYFRLNEGPDDEAGDNGVVAYDSWGGHNGFYTNVFLGQTGCSALDSDTATLFGSTAGGYVFGSDSAVEQIPGIDLGAPTNHNVALSVEAWVKSDPGAAAQPFGAGIVAKGYGGGGEQFCIDCGGANYPTNTFRFFIRDTTGASRIAASTAPAADAGVWHHLVGVFDEANSNVVLYVDGLPNGVGAAVPYAGLQSSAWPASIGSRQSSASTNYNLGFFGDIDEVAIYNHALSSNQVLAHFYAAGIAPRITAQPTNTMVSEGAMANFYAPAYGTPTLAAQWYQSADHGATFAPMAGRTATTLSLTNVPASADGYQFYLQVTNTYGATNSVVATLSVVAGPPQLQMDVPSPVLVYAGRTLSLPTLFFGTPPITYQWYKNGTPLANSSRISGALSNVLTIANAQTNDAGSYQVFAHNSQDGGNPTPSGTASVAVETIPDFNTNGLGWTIQQNGGGIRGISTNVLTLTDGTGNEITSSFYNYPLYIGSFAASFTYQDVGGTGAEADGVAFVLQNDPRGAAALGGGGGGLGLLGITPSAALTFNIYSGAGGGRGLSFGTNGAQGLPYTSTAPLNLGAGNPINVNVLYNGSVVSVTLTDSVAQTSFTTNITANLPAILGARTAYVGLTGADGSTVATQTVSDFTFVPLPMLSAQLTSTNTILLSWPSSVGGYALLQKGNVASGTWTASPAVVNVVGDQYQAVVPPSGGAEFYQLVLQTIEP